MNAIKKLGYAVVIYLAFHGAFSALTPYLLPKEVHAKMVASSYGPELAQHEPVQYGFPVQNAVHRLGGTLYMVLGVMQFLPRLRARRPGLHRLSGRVFMLLSVAAALSGIRMSLTHGYSGLAEVIPTVCFGSFMLFATYKAYRHIRRREIALHREWILRSFAVGLGISTIRFVYVALLFGTAMPARELMVSSFWLGWGLHVVIAEIWINATRRQPVLSPAPAAA